jgi:hypothetical protein
MTTGLRDWVVPEQWLALAHELYQRRGHKRLRPLLTEAASWFVPPSLQALLVSAGHRTLGLDVGANVRLRDRHLGARRCFVIGNGPSLGEQDLRPLAREFTIGANSFYKHPHADEVGLKYLCSADARFFADEPRSVEWHRLIEKHLPDTTLLMNPEIQALMRKHGLYRRNVVHVFANGIKARHARHVHFDLTRPLNVGATTGSMLCIPLAAYLGFKEIYLLGFDCNWLQSSTASYHFYSRHELWKEFDSVGADDRVDRYEVVLNATLRDFRAHYMIAQRTRELGIRVVNATRGGLLDAYPRMKYEDLL